MDIHDLFAPMKRTWAAPARRRGILALISGLLAAGGVASHFLTGPGVLTDTLWLVAAAVAGSDVVARASTPCATAASASSC